MLTMSTLSLTSIRPEQLFTASGSRTKWLLAGVLSLTFGCSSQVMAQKGQTMTTTPSATISAYGVLSDATPVKQVTLKNSNNIEIDVISYGGIITRMSVPDAKGQSGNIVYGFDSLSDYETKNPYFGALIGRYGNRIKDAKFSLFGTEYQLATNDGDNYLHGGVQGFDMGWQRQRSDRQDVD